MRVKKTFCANGHDLSILGRNKHGQCVQCIVINNKQYYIDHKEERCKKARKHHHKNRKLRLSQMKNWRNKNKKRRATYKSKWNKEHKDLVAKDCKKYYDENKNDIQKRRTKYILKKLKEDPLFRFVCNLRNRLKQAIKKNQKTGSAVRDLGCTIEFLKQYLESMFYANMTWDNWGEVWELDHIIPLWKFDLTNRKELLVAVNYKNLQPLTIKDHKNKTAKEASVRATRQ